MRKDRCGRLALATEDDMVYGPRITRDAFVLEDGTAMLLGDGAVKKELSLLLETVKPGDTILVPEISGLARSIKQQTDIIDVVPNGTYGGVRGRILIKRRSTF